MKHDDIDQIRRELASRPRARGALPDDLCARVKACVRSLRATGTKQSEIASELGLSTTTVQRWLRETAPATAIIPVRVIDPPVARASAIVVTSPRGLRIEGLELGDVAVLLERHG